MYIEEQEQEREHDIALFRELAISASADLGLTEDEAEREVEEFINNNY